MSLEKKIYLFSQRHKHLVTFISYASAIFLYWLASLGLTEFITSALPELIENYSLKINKDNFVIFIWALFLVTWFLRKVDEKRAEMYEKIREEEIKEKQKKRDKELKK